MQHVPKAVAVASAPTVKFPGCRPKERILALAMELSMRYRQNFVLTPPPSFSFHSYGQDETRHKLTDETKTVHLHKFRSYDIQHT